MLSNECNQAFETLPASFVDERPSAIVANDFDGDELCDLAVAHFAGGSVSILLNRCTMLGDVNLDGSVNLLDVAPFVQRILDGTCQDEADINRDMAVNLSDIAPFVALIQAGP